MAIKNRIKQQNNKNKHKKNKQKNPYIPKLENKNLKQNKKNRKNRKIISEIKQNFDVVINSFPVYNLAHIPLVEYRGYNAGLDDD